MSQDQRALQIADFTYHLPDDRIAATPLPARDSAKMLLYRAGEITDQSFTHLPEVLPAHTILVANKTAVVPARLLFQKASGGWIEVFCLEPDARYADMQTAMSQKGEVYWQCLVGGASKWKSGMTLTLRSDAPAFTLSAAIAGRTPDLFIIHLHWDNPELSFAEVLEAAGKVPLPPYMQREADASDRERYQTVFAEEKGSVAAPTAALHFSPALLDALRAKGHRTAFTTLHVGAGTFRPVKSATMEGHPMHAETIEVEKTFLTDLRDHCDYPLVAVGTTSLRTLESLYHMGCKAAAGLHWESGAIAISQWEVYEGAYPMLPFSEALGALLARLEGLGESRLVARTQILITPGYTFRTATGLVTNFHQPASTLLLLIAAWIGPDWRRVYDHALASNYRFLSYGDGSLLWRAGE